jgi:predicted RNase H-like nuclease
VGRAGLIAIDAPLAVPNKYGGRSCDRQVAAIFGRYQAGPYPANRRNLARYGGLRGEALVQRLECLGFRHSPDVPHQKPVRQIIEVFPHPATVSLFNLDCTLKYKARQGRSYDRRWRELGRLRSYLSELASAEPPLRLPRSITAMTIEGRRGSRFKRAEDLLDAIVCAYSALYAWYWGPNGYAVYGDSTGSGEEGNSGHIMVPMTPDMWARVEAYS